MGTRQLIETFIKMLGFMFFVYALYNAVSFSYYLFIDFTNIKETQNHFLALGIANVISPIVVGILLCVTASPLAQKILPKEDKSSLLINISAYNLQVILLFSIAVFVALESIAPLVGFSIEYLLTDEQNELLSYRGAQIIGDGVLLILSLALAFGAKTIVGWIRYMRYWYDKEKEL